MDYWKKKTEELKIIVGKVLLCPYCESDNIVFHEFLKDKEDEKPIAHFGLCLDCGSRGPMAGNQIEAVEKWNKQKSVSDRESELKKLQKEILSYLNEVTEIRALVNAGYKEKTVDVVKKLVESAKGSGI